ncbi:MAG: cysteine desulfurase family protein [Cyclobacteriaceae bacterium]
MKVYFDNAATTPLDPEVFQVMKPYLLENYGNPSSIHAHGRIAKAAIEKARKKIAALLGAAPAEIFFTSGGTEANNHALQRVVEAYGLENAITSPLEHHAVLHTLQYLQSRGLIKLHYVQADNKGILDLEHLSQLLSQYPKALVSLMHGNNEIGNLNPIAEIAGICQQFDAYYHCDMVQTIGHFPHDLQNIKVHFASGSAHKFHGPKGVGFLYVNPEVQIPPLNYGGAQERNMRGGTENVAGIMGMASALEIAINHQEQHRKHILSLKKYMIDKFTACIPDVKFNGLSANLQNSLYTVLNVSLPSTDDNDMLLFNLDINQISASAGSACSSGTNIASHVLSALGADPLRGAVRFSFSKYNNREEVSYVVSKLAEIYNMKPVQ